jgi:TIP41-like family
MNLMEIVVILIDNLILGGANSLCCYGCEVSLIVFLGNYSFESQLEIPHVPEMIFAQNCLSLLHERGFGIEFTTLEALKRVSCKPDVVQVAGAKEWKEARLVASAWLLYSLRCSFFDMQHMRNIPIFCRG